eukprot:gene14283-20260_t
MVPWQARVPGPGGGPGLPHLIPRHHDELDLSTWVPSNSGLPPELLVYLRAMSASAADAEVICDRVRGFQSVIRGLKSGKPDGATTSVIQEAISLLSSFIQYSEVTATLIRLEGGTKLLLKVLKTYASSERVLIAAASKVLCRCCISSTIIQQGIVKEKGFATILLNVCNSNSKEANIMGPLFDAMMLLSRYSKGAQQLAGGTLILLCKEALVNFLGTWNVFGSVVKVLKNISKHEGPCSVLSRSDETVKLLLGVMRLLTRLPEQRKILKRTSRTLWLLNRHILSPLPEFEPIWRHPSRDAPHLNILSAMDADVPRHQELFPEDYGGARLPAQGQAPRPSYLPPVTVRPIMYPPDSAPPTAADVAACIAASGNLGQMHDLRRIVHPEGLINRRVYLSTTGNESLPSSNILEPNGSQYLEEGLASMSLNSRTVSEMGGVGDETGGLSGSGGKRSGGRKGGSRGNSGNSERSQAPSELASVSSAPPKDAASASMPPPLEFSSAFESGNLRAAMQFSSAFESGNLRGAMQVYSNEYDLLLASDLNDRSDGGNLCQWFFFSVSNVTPGISYKFNLVNFRKKESLFSQGKLPLVCMGKPLVSTPRLSSARASNPWSVWASPLAPPLCGSRRQALEQRPQAHHPDPDPPVPDHERESQNMDSKVSSTDASKKAGAGGAGGAKTAGSIKEVYGPGPSDVGPGLYCSTFTLQFEASGTYYIASCYPYTYTDLQHHLDSLSERVNKAMADTAAEAQQPPALPFFVRSTLCHSLSGNHSELLTITDFSVPLDVLRQRECIMLTARGILDFLTSDHPTAQTLRSSFIFKIMPMLNPDGVINGSYRCSLAGCDMNRSWDKPVKWTHCTVYHTKKVLQQLAAAGKLALYVDIHGHSNKEDTFFYGCEPNLMGISASAKDARPNQPGEMDPSASSQSNQATASFKGGSAGSGMAIQGSGYAQPTSSFQSQSLPAAAPQVGGAAGLSGGGGSCATQPPAQPAALSARLSARLRVRMLPYLASRISPDFSMPKCSFRIRKAKLSAARVTSRISPDFSMPKSSFRIRKAKL